MKYFAFRSYHNLCGLFKFLQDSGSERIRRLLKPCPELRCVIFLRTSNCGLSARVLSLCSFLLLPSNLYVGWLPLLQCAWFQISSLDCPSAFPSLPPSHTRTPQTNPTPALPRPPPVRLAMPLLPLFSFSTVPSSSISSHLSLPLFYPLPPS